MLVPKERELVATPYRFRGGRQEAERFFLDGMRRAIANVHTASVGDMPTTIYYAFKQAEIESEGVVSTGWATFLEATIEAGFQVDGTWPMRTERPVGFKAAVNGLASSIVLVCRKRPADAPSIGRTEFLRALRQELPPALKTLQASTIAPVDMAQASIGPGMAVFSRYSEVLEADDTPMSVREALMLINHELDAFLAEQEGEFDSYSRFAVGWFEHFGWGVGKFGEANVMATGRGTGVQAIVDAGILYARAGEVRLLKRCELDPAWDIRTDTKITVWECCQHLIRRLEGEGEDSAARLLQTLGHYGERAGDLAYRLYAVCERKRWAEEARAYNGLIVAWPRIARLAEQMAAGPVRRHEERQGQLV